MIYIILLGSVCGLCSIPWLIHFYKRFGRLVKVLKDNDITF